MARTMQMSVALSILLGSSALQLSPEGGVCGAEFTAYEAISQRFPGVCSVFCVPAGQCDQDVIMGKWKGLGITGQGNCKQAGYTETAALGNVTSNTMEYLKRLQGPCKGMKLVKFQKPATVEQKAAPENGVCGKDQTPYESVNPNYPGVCSVFCVPEGDCTGKAQSGNLNNLGITGEGNCKRHGYTEPAELGSTAQNTVWWLKHLQGSCKGMTMTKFQKPGQAEQVAAAPQERACGKEMTAYEARNPQFAEACGLFCVPSGECEGNVQAGQMKQYNIIGPGNCRSSGFTELAEFGALSNAIQNSLKGLAGPCKGMTYTKFQKPTRPEAPAPTDEATEKEAAWP